jgi:aminomethyltransferase
VYYFSESAYRIIVNTTQPALFSSWLSPFEDIYDIDIINRSDLAVMLVSGDDAFDMLVEQFKFTPGIRLSDSQQRFGAQSGRVFVTAVHANERNSYELLASPTELANWQQEFTKLGFINS